jgi:3-oxoacyl-[acyl-carrier-protein] synthase II
VAICGAVDFALVEPIVAGFATMNGAFRHRKDLTDPSPAKTSRPFSIDRRGFVISEGAGCVVIATEEFARAHGLAYEIEIAGWGMTSDAHHFVAPNLQTVAACMAESIARAGMSPSDIDIVNAHAASTRVGDKIEFEALKQVFRNKLPPVSANKSLIGHAMGASSAIESIFAMEGMRRDMVLPTINYTPDPEIELDCVAEGTRDCAHEKVLKNAFGFGGCNSCIVFRRV